MTKNAIQLPDPLGIRNQFPVVEQATYLASASIASSPLSVTQAGVDFIQAKGALPPDLDDMLAKCDYLRGQFAALINASTPEIGLIYTTSEAENMIVRSLNLQPGDNIVTDDLHYFASYVIYSQLAKRGIDIRIGRSVDGQVSAETLAPLCDENTRLVSVAWVSHQTGHVHDLKSLATLAHSHNAYIYADVIQGVGAIPLDVRDCDIDFCAAGSYKWMLGSFGVALIYVRESLMDMIELDRFGFFHVVSRPGELDFELPSDGRKFMFATPAFGPVYQLSAGLEFVNEIGVEKINQHVTGLATYLRNGLADLGFEALSSAEKSAHIVAIKHGRDADLVAQHLADSNIHVNFREGKSQIRIGAALYNNSAEIDTFLAAMSKLA